MHKKIPIFIMFLLFFSCIYPQKNNYTPWQKKIRNYSLSTRKKVGKVTNVTHTFVKNYGVEVAFFIVPILFAHYTIPLTTVEKARIAAQKTLDHSYTGIWWYLLYPLKQLVNYNAHQTLDWNDEDLNNYFFAYKYYNVLRCGFFGINLFKLFKALTAQETFDPSTPEKDIANVSKLLKSEIKIKLS